MPHFYFLILIYLIIELKGIPNEDAYKSAKLILSTEWEYRKA